MKEIGDYTVREIKQQCTQPGMECEDCMFHDPNLTHTCRFKVTPSGYDLNTPLEMIYKPSTLSVMLLDSIPDANWLSRDETSENIDIYKDMPEKHTDFSDDTEFYDGDKLLATVPAKVFPGVVPGDCIEVKTYLKHYKEK